MSILRISIKISVIFTTFKPYIRRYLQRLNKKQKKKQIVLSQQEKETNIAIPKIISTDVDRLQRE